jgi:hypothetical protein
MATEIDLTRTLLDQLTGHWTDILRPRLDGLTDEELLWEPVAGMWSVRHPGESAAPVQAGAGEWLADWAFPEPSPPPVTTIAWRLGHLTIGVLGMRNANHFGGPKLDYESTEWWGSADAALAALDAGYDRWVAGVAGLDPGRLAEPIGPAEGPWAEAPYAALITHIHREVIHHGAEVLLLRDLYRSRATLHG